MDENSRRFRVWVERRLVPQVTFIGCVASGSAAISWSLRTYSDTMRVVFFLVSMSCFMKAYSVIADDESSSDEAVLRAIRIVADRSAGIFTVERVAAELRGVSVTRVERIIRDLERRSRITWQMTEEGIVLYTLPGGPSRGVRSDGGRSDRLDSQCVTSAFQEHDRVIE